MRLQLQVAGAWVGLDVRYVEDQEVLVLEGVCNIPNAEWDVRKPEWCERHHRYVFRVDDAEADSLGLAPLVAHAWNVLHAEVAAGRLRYVPGGSLEWVAPVEGT